MDVAFKKLEELKNTTDLEGIKLALDRLIRAAAEFPESKKMHIDSILKCIFRNNLTAELFDRIEELFPFIRDPRNFIDELEKHLNNRSMTVSTLMFIHELQIHFKMEYSDFLVKLAETVRKENCQSEGYLLFLLQTLKTRDFEDDEIMPIVQRLSEISVEVSSRSCVKVLYSIIVILRMHPGLFRIAKNLEHLYILLNSFEPIAKIARRIFVEAENPECRPSTVFLENFVFPSLEEQM